jgi:hypothetical protein
VIILASWMRNILRDTSLEGKVRNQSPGCFTSRALLSLLLAGSWRAGNIGAGWQETRVWKMEGFTTDGGQAGGLGNLCQPLPV